MTFDLSYRAIRLDMLGNARMNFCQLWQKNISGDIYQVLHGVHVWRLNEMLPRLQLLSNKTY